MSQITGPLDGGTPVPGTVVETLTGNAGVATASANNINVIAAAGSGSFAGAGSTLTYTAPTPVAASYNFMAYKSSNTANATGDGTVVTVVFDSTISNVGAAYNTGTGIFTAPATGLYYFNSTVEFSGMSGAAHSDFIIQFVGSVNTYQVNKSQAYYLASTTYSLGGSIAIPMTIGDTMTVTATVTTGIGGKNVGIYGSALTAVSTFFQGYQVA